MTLAKLVAERDEYLQEFQNRLDDLEQVKTILQDYNALPTHLCRSIETLQNLLRKYMGY